MVVEKNTKHYMFFMTMNLTDDSNPTESLLPACSGEKCGFLFCNIFLVARLEMKATKSVTSDLLCCRDSILNKTGPKLF